MTGLEPRISDGGSKCSTNCATTTALAPDCLPLLALLHHGKHFLLLSIHHRGEMAGFFFNIEPFIMMENCPKAL